MEKNRVKLFEEFINEQDKYSRTKKDSVYAFFNTKTNEIVSRGLDSDMVDYLLYKKNKIKVKHLKVIKNPSEDEIRITDNGTVVFKDGYEPQFVGHDY